MNGSRNNYNVTGSAPRPVKPIFFSISLNLFIPNHIEFPPP